VSLKSRKVIDEFNVIKEGWWYRGKDSSVHIVLKPITKQIYLQNGLAINIQVDVPQINLRLQ